MPLYDGGGAGDSKDRFYFMDVPMMWTMLREHDSGPHHEALKGWRQSYELVLIHRTQVEKYKEKLITAWPPERSKASRAYIERLDHLIESLGETYEAAIANYTAYATAIAAVDDAKWRLESLKREHDANADALSKYAEEMRDRPRAYGKAVAPPPPPSPVADGRQEQLRLQAAGLMTGLSAELATAQMSLTAPRPYDPLRGISDSNESLGTGGFTPILPSSAGFGGPATNSPKVSKPSSSGAGSKTFPTQPAAGRPGPTNGSKPSEGPILGGTKQPLKPPPITGIPSGTPTTVPPTNLPESLNFAPSQSPNSSTSLPRSPSINGNPVGGTPFGSAPPAAGGRGGSPLHGGIIGGSPPMGGAPSGRAGQLGTGARGSRINPLGGMIGQDANAAPARRPRSQSDHESRTQHWDPDNPWETESGINPVLMPSAEQRINPGPTIGGR